MSLSLTEEQHTPSLDSMPMSTARLTVGRRRKVGLQWPTTQETCTVADVSPMKDLIASTALAALHTTTWPSSTESAIMCGSTGPGTTPCTIAFTTEGVPSTPTEETDTDSSS